MKKHMIAVLAVLAVTVGCSGRRVYSITYNDIDEALIQGPTEADAGENVSFCRMHDSGNDRYGNHSGTAEPCCRLCRITEISIELHQENGIVRSLFLMVFL